MRFDHTATLHTTTGTVLLRLCRATRFHQRLIGLMGHPRWQSCPPRCGLWLPGCHGVHGLGLGAALQLLYCIDDPLHPHRHTIVGTDTLQPWGLSVCRRAQHTLELGANSLLPGWVQPGHWLEWHA
jgi:hypothetical protein